MSSRLLLFKIKNADHNYYLNIPMHDCHIILSHSPYGIHASLLLISAYLQFNWYIITITNIKRLTLIICQKDR